MELPPPDWLTMAHEMLGMGEHEQLLLRMAITMELLPAQAGITDEQVKEAYTARIRSEIAEVSDTLKELAEG